MKTILVLMGVVLPFFWGIRWNVCRMLMIGEAVRLGRYEGNKVCSADLVRNTKEEKSQDGNKSQSSH